MYGKARQGKAGRIVGFGRASADSYCVKTGLGL